MNFEKIIDTSIKEVVKSILNNQETDIPKIASEDLENMSKQDKLLMSYSNILLQNYHQALIKELADHGINL